MKHAKIVDGVVDVISLTNPTEDGWVEVPDSVYAGFIDNGDGTYSAPAPPTPSTDPVDYPLNRMRFKAVLRSLERTHGITIAAIEAAMDIVITDPEQNDIAKSKLHDSDRYHRDNPLFDLLKGAVGLTDADIDTAWMRAKDFE